MPTANYNISGMYVENTESADTDTWWAILPNTAVEPYNQCRTNPNNSFQLASCVQPEPAPTPAAPTEPVASPEPEATGLAPGNSGSTPGGEQSQDSSASDTALDVHSGDTTASMTTSANFSG